MLGSTLRTFALNHKQLQGSAGAVAVLHTHARNLDFHPHVHVAMPASALDADKRLWRSLRRSKKGGGYLFSHKALAKVFAAKLQDALREGDLVVPTDLPEQWVVDCKSVGSGQKVLISRVRQFAPLKRRFLLQKQALALDPQIFCGGTF